MSRNSGNWLSVCCQTGAQVKVLIAVKVIWLRRFLWARIHHASHCVCWPFARCHTPPPPMFLRPSFFTSITAHLQGVATISFHFCGSVGMSGPCWLSIQTSYAALVTACALPKSKGFFLFPTCRLWLYMLINTWRFLMNKNPLICEQYNTLRLPKWPYCYHLVLSRSFRFNCWGWKADRVKQRLHRWSNHENIYFRCVSLVEFKCDVSNAQPFQKSNLSSCDFTIVSMSGKIVGLESSYKNITKWMATVIITLRLSWLPLRLFLTLYALTYCINLSPNMYR